MYHNDREILNIDTYIHKYVWILFKKFEQKSKQELCIFSLFFCIIYIQF